MKIKRSFPGVDLKKIIEAVRAQLPKGKAILEVSLIFVSADKMRKLNLTYRGSDKPTNILSFEEGDVVICPEIAEAEAKEHGFTQKYWMTRLVVHGILHLVGYDHKSINSRKAMEKLEDKVLNKLCL